MKSFSGGVKEYLLKKSREEFGFGEKDRQKSRDCCEKAFLSAFFLFGIQKKEDRFYFRRGLLPLLQLSLLLLKKRGEWEEKPCDAKRMLASSEFSEIVRNAEAEEFSCPRCAEHFLRSAFISCGTVLDPQKGYHLSFSCPKKEKAEKLSLLLAQNGIEAGISSAPAGYSVYIKDSEKIMDFFALIGAQKISIDLMNAKIEKSIRNNVNRKQNFDDANIKKSVDRAQEVILAIRYLKEKGLENNLPESLKHAAKLRLAYPEASLAELCSHSDEPITKSGLNHRFSRICTIAQLERNGDKKDEK